MCWSLFASLDITRPVTWLLCMCTLRCWCRNKMLCSLYFNPKFATNGSQLRSWHARLCLPRLCSTTEWPRWITTLCCSVCPGPSACWLSWCGVELWASHWSAPSPWARMDWWHWWEPSRAEEPPERSCGCGCGGVSVKGGRRCKYQTADISWPPVISNPRDSMGFKETVRF